VAGAPDSPAGVLEQGIERRVITISADPDQRNVQVQLEGAIEDLLTVDAERLAAVRALLGQAPSDFAVRQGDGSVFTAGSVHGSVYAGTGNTFFAREDPRTVAAKHFAAGEQHLSLGLRREAAEDFALAATNDPANPAAYYLAAVALLDGAKAFRASLQRIREIEQLIRAAIELDDRGIYHYFLAYLSHDYYERKYLKPVGSWRAPALEAAKRGVTREQIDGLFSMLSVDNPLPDFR
jgi:tetratricopeptide (TPR) repeat protein